MMLFQSFWTARSMWPKLLFKGFRLPCEGTFRDLWNLNQRYLITLRTTVKCTCSRFPCTCRLIGSNPAPLCFQGRSSGLFHTNLCLHKQMVSGCRKNVIYLDGTFQMSKTVLNDVWYASWMYLFCYVGLMCSSCSCSKYRHQLPAPMDCMVGDDPPIRLYSPAEYGIMWVKAVIRFHPGFTSMLRRRWSPSSSWFKFQQAGNWGAVWLLSPMHKFVFITSIFCCNFHVWWFCSSQF